MTTQQRLRAAGIIATIAGLLGATGDLLLFYSPGFAADLFAVHALPTWRITAGFLLAILVIPLLPVGYWMIAQYLKPAGERVTTAILLIGVYGAGLGNAIHGTVGVLTQVVQRNGFDAAPAGFIETYARYVVPLYGLFYVLMLVGSVIFARAIWREDTPLPRWLVVLLPIFSNVLVLPLAEVLPALGDVLVPSIANLSHAVLFGVVAGMFWGREAKASTQNST